MNVLDIILAVPILWFLYRGWKRGIVREVSTLLGMLVGVWAAMHLSQTVAEWLRLGSEEAVLVAFMVCFVGAMVLVYLLGRMIEGLMKAAKINVFNHIAGALLGMVKALVLLSVLLSYTVLLDSEGHILKEKVRSESLLYKPVYHTGSRLTASLKEYINDHKQEWRKELER